MAKCKGVVVILVVQKKLVGNLLLPTDITAATIKHENQELKI